MIFIEKTYLAEEELRKRQGKGAGGPRNVAEGDRAVILFPVGRGVSRSERLSGGGKNRTTEKSKGREKKKMVNQTLSTRISSPSLKREKLLIGEGKGTLNTPRATTNREKIKKKQKED